MSICAKVTCKTVLSWYFEPSQPQRITSRLKTMFNLSPIYSARKSSNHKLSINTKSVLTQIYIKQSIHKHRTQNFRRISPFGITPVKKAHKARARWYRWLFRRFINTRFFFKYKKRDGQKQLKKQQKTLLCATVTFRKTVCSYAKHELGDWNVVKLCRVSTYKAAMVTNGKRDFTTLIDNRYNQYLCRIQFECWLAVLCQGNKQKATLY